MGNLGDNKIWRAGQFNFQEVLWRQKRYIVRENHEWVDHLFSHENAKFLTTVKVYNLKPFYTKFRSGAHVIIILIH